MIDFTKPLETVDGTPVTSLRSEGPNYNVVQIEGVGQFIYRENGKHVFGRRPDIRNVAAVVTLDTSRPLQTRSGTPVKLEGTLPDGRLVITVPGAWGIAPTPRIVAADGRAFGGPVSVEHADDIINVPAVRKTEVLNIYADGSVGQTVHASIDAARGRSKYGKVRVGYLFRELVDGKIVDASVRHAEPFLRTRSNPSGSNPYA